MEQVGPLLGSDTSRSSCTLKSRPLSQHVSLEVGDAACLVARPASPHFY